MKEAVSGLAIAAVMTALAIPVPAMADDELQLVTCEESLGIIEVVDQSIELAKSAAVEGLVRSGAAASVMSRVPGAGAMLGTFGGLGGELTVDAEAAHELYKRIFTGDITAALEGKSKLIFPSGGSLAAIPPSVLISRSPEANAAPAFLIRDYAIAIIAGLGLRKKNEGAPAMTFAGIGAPKLADVPADRAGLRGAVVDGNSFLELPSLPGAMSELEALDAAFFR